MCYEGQGPVQAWPWLDADILLDGGPAFRGANFCSTLVRSVARAADIPKSTSWHSFRVKWVSHLPHEIQCSVVLNPKYRFRDL
jgi:hypothetical protein